MNTDPMKMIAVVNGTLPKQTSVGWKFNGNGTITRYFVAFGNDGIPLQAKDGTIKLNCKDYKNDR